MDLWGWLLYVCSDIMDRISRNKPAELALFSPRQSYCLLKTQIKVKPSWFWYVKVKDFIFLLFSILFRVGEKKPFLCWPARVGKNVRQFEVKGSGGGKSLVNTQGKQ